MIPIDDKYYLTKDDNNLILITKVITKTGKDDSKQHGRRRFYPSIKTLVKGLFVLKTYDIVDEAQKVNDRVKRDEMLDSLSYFEKEWCKSMNKYIVNLTKEDK